MDKTKPAAADELALLKSAAWARYQHGGDARPLRESDVWRSTRIEPRPSRYKLEALKIAKQSSNYSLFDNYEIERISKQLDHYIESSRGGASRGAAAAEMKNDGAGKKTGRGLWLRRIPVCGSRDDVGKGKGFEKNHHGGRGRVAVVGFMSCRPRLWGIRV